MCALLLLLLALVVRASAPVPPPLHPAPVEAALGPGRASAEAARLEVDPAVASVARAALGVLRARLEAGGLPPAEGGAAAVAVVVDAFDTSLPREGFVLELSDDRISVRAADRRGLLWAASALGQLVRGGSWPLGRVRDHPALARRWTHVRVPGRDLDGSDRFAALGLDADRLLAALDSHFREAVLLHRINGIVVEAGPAIRLRSHPEWAVPGALPIERLAPLLRELRALGVDTIPLLDPLCHQEKALAPVRPDLMLVGLRGWMRRARPGGRGPLWWPAIADPRSPEVRAAYAEALDELLRVFEPPIVHLGHDECGALAVVPRERDADVVELFAEDVARWRDRLAARGARVAIWADMLLDPARVPGHGLGSLPGAPTWRALDRLPRDVVLVDWQYFPAPRTWLESGPRPDVPSARYLAAAGFEVVGATARRPVRRRADLERARAAVLHDARFARTLAALGPGAGLLATHWSFTGRAPPPGTAWLAWTGAHAWTGGREPWPTILDRWWPPASPR